MSSVSGNDRGTRLSTRQFDELVGRRQTEQLVLEQLKQRLQAEQDSMDQRTAEDYEFAIKTSEMLISDMLNEEQNCVIVDALDTQRTEELVEMAIDPSLPQPSSIYQQIDKDNGKGSLLTTQSLHGQSRRVTAMDERAIEHQKKITEMRFLKEELQLQKELQILQREIEATTSVAGGNRPVSQSRTGTARATQASQAALESISKRTTTTVSNATSQKIRSQSQEKGVSSGFVNVDLYIDYIRLARELVFDQSVVNVRAFVASDSKQAGKDQQLSSSTKAPDGADSFIVKFAGSMTFSCQKSLLQRSILIIEVYVTEGGGVKDAVGWSLFSLSNQTGQLKQGYWLLSCIESPINMTLSMSQFDSSSQLNDIAVYARLFLSDRFEERNIDVSTIALQDYINLTSLNMSSVKSVQNRSSRQLSSSQKNQVTFENAVAKESQIGQKRILANRRPQQSLSQKNNKELVFMARSMKSLAIGSGLVNLKIAFEKISGLFEVCSFVKLRMGGLGLEDSILIPDLNLNFSRKSWQLKEKAELVLRKVNVKPGVYIQFEVCTESGGNLCWSRINLFRQSENDRSLTLNSGLIDCQVYKFPVSDTPVKLPTCSILTRVAEIDASGVALGAASGLTPLPKDCWIPVKSSVDYENVFEDPSGFAICIDAARFLPQNVLFSKVSAQILDVNYQPTECPKLETEFDLETDSRMPVYMAVKEYPTNSLDRRSTLLFKIRAMDQADKTVKTLGFTFLNMYVDTSTLSQPDSAQCITRLNSGAYQLPIFQGQPDVTVQFNMKNAHRYVPLPCATLLIRIVPLTELVQEFPFYSQDIYDSTACTPTESEGLIYLQLLQDMKMIRYSQQIDLLRDNGMKNIGTSESEAIDWLKLMFLQTEPKQSESWDYSIVAPYYQEHGFKISLDRLQNVESRQVCLGIVSLNPPAAMYHLASEEAANSLNVRYTTQISLESFIKSPLYQDGYWTFKPNFSSNTFAIVDIRQLSFEQKATLPLPVGWTAIPLFNSQGYVIHGNFQLPLYKGSPTKSQLLTLQEHQFPYHAMSEMATQGQIKRLSAASVFVRVCDARREAELPMKSNLDQRFIPQNDRASFRKASSSNPIQSIIPKGYNQNQFQLEVASRLKDFVYSSPASTKKESKNK